LLALVPDRLLAGPQTPDEGKISVWEQANVALAEQSDKSHPTQLRGDVTP